MFRPRQTCAMSRYRQPRPSTRVALATLDERRADQAKAKPKVKDEHTEQAELMSWLSLAWPGLVVFAVPNAAKRSAYLAQRLKAEGLESGVPDVYIEEARGGWFGLRIEMKRSDQARRADGGLSEAQERFIPRLQAKGYKVAVCYSSAQAIKTVETYMQSPKTVSVTVP